jgi:hypothetical protein
MAEFAARAGDLLIVAALFGAKALIGLGAFAFMA